MSSPAKKADPLALACAVLARLVIAEYPSGISLVEIAETWGEASPEELTALSKIDALKKMNSPAERAPELVYAESRDAAEKALDESYLTKYRVFEKPEDAIPWLRAGGLVVLDKQQAETVRRDLTEAAKPSLPQYMFDSWALLSAGEGPK